MRMNLNPAHLHLVVNHVSFIGTIIGLLVLLLGYFLKADVVKKTALGIFMGCAVFAIVAKQTGEGAAHMIKSLPGIEKSRVRAHDELAGKYMVLMIALGICSALVFAAEKRKPSLTKWLYGLIWLLVAGSIVLSAFVGDTGGEIRHPEIRPDNTDSIQQPKN
jgi:uncharacterized membrane protein